MAAYADRFADSGEINWLPYLMYFHPEIHASKVVSTDSYGFRFSGARGVRYSATECADLGPARLLVGSSTVFGIGATTDTRTLSLRAWRNGIREMSSGSISEAAASTPPRN